MSANDTTPFAFRGSFLSDGRRVEQEARAFGGGLGGARCAGDVGGWARGQDLRKIEKVIRSHCHNFLSAAGVHGGWVV